MSMMESAFYSFLRSNKQGLFTSMCYEMFLKMLVASMAWDLHTFSINDNFVVFENEEI